MEKMSARLTQVLNAMPPEAQQFFVEKHLTSLLDMMPKDISKQVLSAATRLQRKYKGAPALDLRAKKKQVNNLLDDLIRDAKISFIKERSNREELLSEIIHTLSGWLSDIWAVVYEHSVNFDIAHQCLVFIADALAQLSESSSLGGCKCSVMNLPVEVYLKNKKGKTIKHFSVLGPQNINRILLWIWRDLFVSLFANGGESDKQKVPHFLEDIESSLGVGALERVLYGGRPVEADDDDDDDDDIEDDDNIDYMFDEEQLYADDNSGYDSDTTDRCPCNLHAPYWPEKMNKERLPLRNCVENRLFAIFKVSPSIRIYNTLLTISEESSTTEMRVTHILRDIAGDSPENLVAALDINISNGKQSMIAILLNTHGYLLRPRDSVTLQCAVAMLDNSPYHSQCLEILEKQLEESLKAICAGVRSCFPHIDENTNKNDINEILKLRTSSPTRQERLERWVDRISSSSNAPLHPMAFAAMMMGLPVLPGSEEGDDADILNYVDLDQMDADLDDLREEYRPDLKGMFDGWAHLGQSIQGGPPILAKMYAKALELMPWLRGSDITGEMLNKLRERPNKNYVLEALSVLNSFCKTQRKKINLARAEQQKRTGDNRTQSHTATQQGHGEASSSRSPPPPPLFTSQATVPPYGSPSSSTSPPPASMAPMFNPANAAPFTLGPPTPVSGNGPATPLSFPFSRSFSPVPGGMEDVD